MVQGLSVTRLVDVDINLSPLAAPTINFDTLLIMGDSDVINTYEAIREYNTIAEVAVDFLTTSPEYLAASLFFSQIPQPDTLYIGRWARTPTKGELVGGSLSAVEQTLSNWTAITSGGFSIVVDGVAKNLTALNFSGVTNLNGVASTIDAALTGATVAWTGDHFIIKSETTGAASTVGFATAPGSGSDISALLKLTAATAQYAVAGVIAETPVAGVTRVDGRGWYAITFASSVALTTSQHLAVAAYVEASTDRHLYGVTSDETAILDAGSTVDVASQLSLLGYTRTVGQYSSLSDHAISSFFGRAFTVNFNGSNTTITMMYKREPGVAPEVLTATQASTIESKRFNVYAQYNNDTAIIQNGVMSGPAYFDEIHGLDWLANRIQTDLFNTLYQAPKIPQTDVGVNILVTACEKALTQAVSNGLVAPGTWNAAGFGNLVQGQFLSKGWYIFADSVNNQSQADREARISPLIQIAVKLAGAVHTVDVLINVNR